MSGRDSDERWRRQFEIFDRALEKEPEERAAFVAEACGDDVELRREIEALLAGHEGRSPLDASVGAVAEALEEETRSLAARERGPGAGTILADRFEIVGLLGRGGMGTVYKARDLRLGATVALKLLCTEVAGSSKARARFLREINLARRVTHPNVCRVYDLVEDDGQVILTMELLDGQTLTDHMQQSGRMNLQEAKEILIQVSAALEAAHNVGVVHRDLKPSNIMLVQGSGKLRAVVTDFGLATSQGPTEGTDLELTRSGQILGTPAYMAPEQLEGEETTPSTDVYALGLILFEMVTGRKAHEGDTPLSIATRRLSGKAPSPRSLVPELDQRWEAVILRCLERRPANRFARPREVVEQLTGHEPTVTVAQRRHERSWRAVGWSSLALLVLLGTFIVIGPPSNTAVRDTELPSAEVQPRVPFEQRDTVLVAAFDNRTQEESWNGALGLALARELSSSTFLTVAPRYRIVDTLLLMQRSPESSVDAELAREIALRDGEIRVLVTGEIEKLGSIYVVSARIVDPGPGATLAVAEAEARGPDEIYEAVKRLALQVRGLLGETLSSIQQHEKRLVKVSTPSLDALRLYTEADAIVGGMTFQWSAAVELLEQALAADPDFASAHLLMARVLGILERHEESARHLDRAMELSDRAPEGERYHIRSVYFDAQGNAERARANREVLLRLHPSHFWANQAEALERSFAVDPREAIPFQIRKARSRPTNLDANWDAGQLLAMLTDRDDETRDYFDRVVRLGEVGEARGNTYELTYARLWRAHQLWLVGDVDSCKSELDRWAELLPQSTGAEAAALRVGLRWGYWALGLASRATSPELIRGNRRFMLGTAAYARGDAEEVRGHLGDVRQSRSWPGAAQRDPLRVAFLARSGFLVEATAIATSFYALPWEPTPPSVPEDPEVLFDLVRGELALAEGRTREGVDLLERRLAQYWRRAGSHVRGPIYYESSIGLAHGWRDLDEPERAVAALERASRQRKQTHPYAREHWLRAQLELAKLYRTLGRVDDADAIENELRQLMRLADSDFWLVQEVGRSP